MIRQRLLLSIPFLGLTTTSAFGFGAAGPASSVAFSRSSVVKTNGPSTCLYAEEAEGGDAEGAEEHPAEDLLPSESQSDILNSPAFLRRKLDVLKSDLKKLDEDIDASNEALEKGKAEWGSQLDDLQKEYVNIQNRMSKQNKEGGGAATIEVVRKMLDVMDNYDRAFNSVSPETDEEKEVEAAYRNTRDSILKVFEDQGVTEVECLGKEFDYEVHQAVLQRPSEYEEGIVCEELAKGYILGDKLIRAAMVAVGA